MRGKTERGVSFTIGDKESKICVVSNLNSRFYFWRAFAAITSDFKKRIGTGNGLPDDRGAMEH
jgi:hypothetical protein